MKMLISLLVVSALATACSSGGGGGSAGPSAPGANFKPNEKPANAASMQDVEAMFAQLKKSEEFLPENNAIFKAVLAGAEKQIVSAQDKETAIRKLNPQGATFLANILTGCTISDAQSFGGNEPPQVNVPVRKNGYLSTRGAKCPYIVNEQVQQDTTYTSASNTSVAGVVKQISVMTKNILDDQVIMATGLIAFSQTMDITNNFTVTQTNNTSTINALVNGNGTIEIKMIDANGDGKLSGPVTVQGTLANGVMDMHMLFEGVSKKGVVRVVVQMNSSTGGKIFVNGEEISPEKIGGLPKAFTNSIEQ
ncbi:MAG TPA: hypothetical protein VGE46_00415 [Bdellovibrio sp.]